MPPFSMQSNYSVAPANSIWLTPLLVGASVSYFGFNKMGTLNTPKCQQYILLPYGSIIQKWDPH
jgi:hypothetical protein